MNEVSNFQFSKEDDLFIKEEVELDIFLNKFIKFSNIVSILLLFLSLNLKKNFKQKN